ncbi:MAG: MFS transporter [Kiloniellales bacterium]
MIASRTNWTGVIYGLSLSFFAAYQLFRLPPALPLLLERYGYDRALAGGFMSVYALAGLLTSLYLGRQIERHGIARPVLAALVIMVAGNLLSLLWPEQGLMMLAARGLEGIAFAALAIAGPVLAQRETSARQLPLVIGLTAAWMPVGQMVAAVAAPFAFALYGWQLLWIAALAGCLALAAWTMVLAGRGTVALGPHHAEGSTRPSEPITPAQRRTLMLAAAVFMLWSGQYIAAMTWLPQFLVEAQGLALDSALAAYLLPVAVLALFNLLTGVLLRAGVPLGLLLLGAVASQAVLWLLVPMGQGALGLALLVIYGMGAGIAPACLFAMPNAIVGQSRRAAGAFGVMMTGRNLGVLVGPVLIGQVFKLTGNWSDVVPVFAALALAATVLAAALALRLARLGPAAHGTSR